MGGSDFDCSDTCMNLYLIFFILYYKLLLAAKNFNFNFIPVSIYSDIMYHLLSHHVYFNNGFSESCQFCS